MRPLHAPNAPKAPRAALLAGLLLGTPGCGIIAGLGEHEPLQIAAGPPGFPDSMTVICSNTKDKIDCPKEGEPYFGQDGSFSITRPSYTADEANDVVTDN